MADIDTTLFEKVRRGGLAIREAAAALTATDELPHPENVLGNMEREVKRSKDI